MTQANHVAGVVRTQTVRCTIANRVDVETIVNQAFVGQLGITSLNQGTLAELIGVQGGPDLSLGVSQGTGLILDLASSTVLDANGVLAEGLGNTQRPSVTLVEAGSIVNLGVVVQGGQLGLGRQGVNSGNAVDTGVRGIHTRDVLGSMVTSSDIQRAIVVLTSQLVGAGFSAIVAIGLGFAIDVGDGTRETTEGRGNVGDGVGSTIISTGNVAGDTAGHGHRGAEASCTRSQFNLGAHGTQRMGQVTGNSRTETTGQADVGIATTSQSTGGISGETRFVLEDSLQAVAQIFNTLETDVGGVGIQTANPSLVVGVNAGAGRLNIRLAEVNNTVNGDIGLGESGGRSQSSNCQSDNLLIQPRVSSKENDNFPLYFNMFAQNNHPIRFRKIGIKGDYLLNFLH